MNAIIALAAIAITAALGFYTLGVFGERQQGLLQKRHVVMFWLGLCCDTTGTLLMSVFARSEGAESLGLHAIAGMVAIALMVIHAVWASIVFVRGGRTARAVFSRFSIVVWLVWLVPYVCGMLIGMPMFQMDGSTALAIAVATVLVVATLIGLYDTKKHVTPNHA